MFTPRQLINWFTSDSKTTIIECGDIVIFYDDETDTVLTGTYQALSTDVLSSGDCSPYYLEVTDSEEYTRVLIQEVNDNKPYYALASNVWTPQEFTDLKERGELYATISPIFN